MGQTGSGESVFTLESLYPRGRLSQNDMMCVTLRARQRFGQNHGPIEVSTVGSLAVQFGV